MIALLRSFAVSPSGILLGQSSPIACSMPPVFAPGLDFDSRSVERSSGAGAARPSEGHCRNRRDTQHLSFAVIFRLFARTAGKRCKLLLRQEMQIAVVLMDPVAVAVEAASHGAQKRLHFVSPAMFDQRLYPPVKKGRAPRGSTPPPDLRIGDLPFRVCRQERTQTRRKGVDDGARSLIESEPDQSFALLIGDSGVTEGQQQATRPGRRD